MSNIDAQAGASERFKPCMTTPDECRRMLMTPVKVLEHISRFCGTDNVNELIRLVVGNSDVVDVDTMAFCEDFGFEKINQYTAALPEFEQLRINLRALAKRFASAITKDKTRLRYYIDRSFIGSGDRRRLNAEQGVARLFFMINELCSSLSPVLRQVPTYREARLMEFETYLLQLLFLEIMKAMDNFGYDNNDKEQITELLCCFSCGVTDHDGVEKTFSPIRITRIHLGQFGEILEEFGEPLNKFVADYDGNIEDLKLENFLKGADIGRFSVYRKVSSCEKTISGMKLSLIPHRDNTHGVSLCTVDLVLDPSNADSSTLFFTLDRAGQEIFVGDTFIPLADIVDPKTYEIIRSLIYDLVLENLTLRHEDDFDDLFIGCGVKEAVNDIADDTNDDVETVMTPAPVQWLGFDRIRRRAAKSKRVLSGGANSNGEIFEDEEVDRVDFERFTDVAGATVLRILTRILGEPVRIHGSHHIFKNVSGLTLPIPIHFGRPVNRHILVRQLKMWGILQEFCTEL